MTGKEATSRTLQDPRTLAHLTVLENEVQGGLTLEEKKLRTKTGDAALGTLHEGAHSHPEEETAPLGPLPACLAPWNRQRSNTGCA